ncbi:MAG: response regulator [Gemmatimonadota bacterium]|nr:response regulator [Gemmatimonadota bacterium]
MTRKSSGNSIPEPPLTTGDISRYCHTTVMQVNRWIKNDALKAFQTPGGQSRITIEEFRQFLERNGMPIVEEFFKQKTKKKILVADDDSAVVKAISYLLRSQPDNYEVEVSRDGYETLIKAGDFKPDLLILDIRMPKIDGLEVCRRLRQNPDITRGIKILAITGHSEAYDRETVLESGANEYLLKPFEKKSLLDHVEKLIG